jgi:5-methylcytosine-specific restriction protein A
MRNPPWQRDELILALDLYLQHRPSLPAKNSPEILKLSELLNQLRVHTSSYRDERYRNANGVYMKLCNFLSLDPQYQGSGLQRRGKTEETIWTEFSKNPERCRQEAEVIRTFVQSDIELQELAAEDDNEGVEEGSVLTKIHKRRERSQQIVKKCKDKFLKEHGRLFCEACGFDFEQTYGERGKGFIECHHKKPLHILEPGEKTFIKDLAIVCSNCHRMIHAKRPWLTISELETLIKSHQTDIIG